MRLLAGLAVGLMTLPGAAVLLSEQPASAGVAAASFVCTTGAGVPATSVVTKDGKRVPVIRWTSNVFNDAGWSPQRRCQEVSPF